MRLRTIGKIQNGVISVRKIVKLNPGIFLFNLLSGHPVSASVKNTFIACNLSFATMASSSVRPWKSCIGMGHLHDGRCNDRNSLFVFSRGFRGPFHFLLVYVGWEKCDGAVSRADPVWQGVFPLAKDDRMSSFMFDKLRHMSKAIGEFGIPKSRLLQACALFWVDFW